jgi:Ca2+-binding RTX toxin-like protein
MPIIAGTNEDDTLTGAGFDDTIFGLGGNDILSGGWNGWDVLFGGAGDDTLLGSGADTLVGEAGNDRLEYGALMVGGAGDDLYLLNNLDDPFDFSVVETADGGVDTVEWRWAGGYLAEFVERARGQRPPVRLRRA